VGVWLGMMQVFLAAGSHPLLTWRSWAGATGPQPSAGFIAHIGFPLGAHAIGTQPQQLVRPASGADPEERQRLDGIKRPIRKRAQVLR
jgi:hypothetical protein